jgi:phosphohistidine phosphatase
LQPDDHDSHQGGVIAFREGDAGIEICLISKKDSTKWGIPKGIVDPGYTLAETALNEAHEEAGLRGELLGGAIGNYILEKWGIRFRVSVFLMRVTCEEDTWEEDFFRARHWVAPREALWRMKSHKCRPVLERAIDILEGGKA